MVIQLFGGCEEDLVFSLAILYTMGPIEEVGAGEARFFGRLGL